MEEKTNILEGRKTLIINLLISASALYPPVGEWVSANPELVLQIMAGVNIGLRLITKGKVRLWK